MIRILGAYGACLVTLLVLDGVWLGLLARPLYTRGIGHLMATTPRLDAAAAFYAIYAAGLVFFAVWPQAAATGWLATMLTGAAFGAVAYATYDLSNLATLRDWPPGLSMLDIGWGSLLSALAALAGRLAHDRLAG